jgi:hypothetical protein
MIADTAQENFDIRMYTLYLKAIVSDDGHRRINFSHFYHMRHPHPLIF